MPFSSFCRGNAERSLVNWAENRRPIGAKWNKFVVAGPGQPLAGGCLSVRPVRDVDGRRQIVEDVSLIKPGFQFPSKSGIPFDPVFEVFG